MDDASELREAARVATPIVSNTLSVNVFTALGNAMVGERPKPFGRKVDGGYAEANNGSCAERGLSPTCLESNTGLVHLWRQGQEYSAAGSCIHGRASPLPADRCGQGCFSYGDGIKSRNGREADRSRGIGGLNRRSVARDSSMSHHYSGSDFGVP